MRVKQRVMKVSGGFYKRVLMTETQILSKMNY